MTSRISTLCSGFYMHGIKAWDIIQLVVGRVVQVVAIKREV